MTLAKTERHKKYLKGNFSGRMTVNLIYIDVTHSEIYDVLHTYRQFTSNCQVLVCLSFMMMRFVVLEHTLTLAYIQSRSMYGED